MKITQLHVFPVKSLRGIAVPSATLCAQGLAYDRRYILLKPQNGAYVNMFIGDLPEMALFHCTLSSTETTFTVSYRTPSPPVTSPHPAQNTTIEIPFEPECTDLPEIKITMHTTPDCVAHLMPQSYNTWFSACFGYEAVLAYMGDGLGTQQRNEKTESWISRLTPIIPTHVEAVNFSDSAALLVASEASLEDLHPRLGNGEKAIMSKFRPNIVFDGEGVAWDEDFWGELTVTRIGAKIVLTSHCARCVSVNVDLEKGRMGEGESGKLLKKMMRDRRVDTGHKWTPVFGRYGFPITRGEIRVGDEVVISRRLQEHAVFNGLIPRLAKLD